MTHTSFLNARKGFTLVELLVTIAIIGILLGLLLPNLAAVQSTAKAGAQAAILQQFGKGFIDFSTLDSEGRLASSAYDHYRDGDATKVGWVADLVNNKYANPTKSLDPISRSKVNEKFADMAGAVTSGKANNVRWLSNVSYNYAGTTITSVNNTTVAGTAYFGTTQTLWDSGYNTNFATTWHFSRGDNNITATTGAGRYANNASSLDPSKSPLDGDGPLSSAILADPSMLSSADKIALMGPSRNGDGSDSQVNSSGVNAADTINLFIDPTGRKKIVKVGDFTVESFTDGPSASRNLTANQEGVYAVTANQQVHEINDIVPNAKAKKVRQPSGRDIQAGGYANILFADGSNRRVNDNNGYGGANKGDSFVGPYITNIDATQEADRTFVLDNGAYDEVRDDLYLGRMRLLLTAGGGSAE